jgi:hypothetical protein
MQRHTSKNTCVNTLPAVLKLAEKQGAWLPGGRNLDLGCGCYRKIDDFLEERGVESVGYDKYRPESTDKGWAIAESCQTATCSNVLNVIDCEDARQALIVQANACLKRGGRLFVTVYEGDKSGEGRESKPDCWQENRATATYLPELEAVFGRGNVIRKGKLIIASKA